MGTIGVIGGGRFGTCLAKSLAEQGSDVLFMDRDRDVVQRMSGWVSKAVQGDAADQQALEEAGFAGCDVVVVSMASNLEASILATMALKDLRVPKVIAKAASDNAGKVLERVGADKIVYPERDRAIRLARTLLAKTVIDYMQVSPDSGIIELQLPETFAGKTLAETRIRNVYGLTVLEIRRKGENGALQSIPAPGGDHVMVKGDTLVIFGSEENLRQFERHIR
jgi:trk system potassium uptake protein TrkA